MGDGSLAGLAVRVYSRIAVLPGGTAWSAQARTRRRKVRIPPEAPRTCRGSHQPQMRTLRISVRTFRTQEQTGPTAMRTLRTSGRAPGPEVRNLRTSERSLRTRVRTSRASRRNLHTQVRTARIPRRVVCISGRTAGALAKPAEIERRLGAHPQRKAFNRWPPSTTPRTAPLCASQAARRSGKRTACDRTTAICWSSSSRPACCNPATTG